jgi:hypothetical protein
LPEELREVAKTPFWQEPAQEQLLEWLLQLFPQHLPLRQ